MKRGFRKIDNIVVGIEQEIQLCNCFLLLAWFGLS